MALAAKGVIALDAGRARGIRLLAPWDEETPPQAENRFVPCASLPIIGRVAAGEPILAVAHIESYLSIAPDAFHPRADYLLRVEGQSMTGAGILPGDLVAVRKTPEAVPGAIIVARLGDEVTVKRLCREGNTLFLEAANERYPPRRVDSERDHLSKGWWSVSCARSGSSHIPAILPAAWPLGHGKPSWQRAPPV